MTGDGLALKGRKKKREGALISMCWTIDAIYARGQCGEFGCQ